MSKEKNMRDGEQRHLGVKRRQTESSRTSAFGAIDEAMVMEDEIVPREMKRDYQIIMKPKIERKVNKIKDPLKQDQETVWSMNTRGLQEFLQLSMLNEKMIESEWELPIRKRMVNYAQTMMISGTLNYREK